MKLLTAFLLIPIGIFSQDVPSTSSGSLKFYVDFSSFKGKEGKTYQEFYLMIHADQLYFSLNDDQPAGLKEKNTSFKVSTVIKDYNNKVISEHNWVTDAILSNDSLDLRSLAVYDQWAELLEPGEYHVYVNVSEQEHSTSGIAEFDINVSSFGTGNFSASDLEFISKVETENRSSHFEKNGRNIIPNPWRRYGLLIPKLSFYYEIYNIPDPDADKFLLADYIILNNDNSEAKKISGIEIKKSGTDISVVHAVDLEGLKSGIFTLKADITDPESDQKITLSRPFEIIHTDYPPINPLLSPEEAEAGGKLIEHIASPEEKRIFRSLSLQGKINFLINFWKERDTSPGTPENEFQQNIKQKYDYANEHFGWGNTEGYKTDRGRIIIQYGIPDEINRYYSESDTAPYEIWTYTRDKIFIFVFGDINSNGNFILLHSTKEGEISNYNWEDYIRSF